MTLRSTKYSNNFRTVSGTISADDNDVVLACDTTSSPSVVNLQTIPSGNWNTQWSLFVYDASNNASVNNITIAAPVGFKINGASSITISTNGGYCRIFIANNLSYLAFLSTFGPGGLTQAYTTIQDEGVSLPQRNILNFVGNGVVAVDSGGKTVVTINGGLISLTNSAINALISGASIIPGQFYLITDPINASLGVIVQGSTTISTSTSGLGIFLNADYQMVGNYSGVSGFVAALGLWSNVSKPVVIGDVVVWNNNHYKNITGSWGSDPNGDPTNWTLLTKSTTTGFITETDFVEYNTVTNLVQYRADKRNNKVELYSNGGHDTIADFQWGRDVVTYNHILGQSIFSATNTYCTLTANIFHSAQFSDSSNSTEPGSYINNQISSSICSVAINRGQISNNIINTDSTFTISVLNDQFSVIDGNIISENSRMIFTTLNGITSVRYNTLLSNSGLTSTATISVGTITNNFGQNSGTLTFAGTSTGTLTGCEVSDGLTASLVQITTTLSNYKARKGYSNWPSDLDYSTVFSAGTCTIPASLAYVGVFTIKNGNSTNTTKILNSPTNHAFSFIANVGDTIQITPTTVSTAVAGNILSQNSGVTLNVVGRTNGTDEVVLKGYGNLIGTTGIDIWQ